MTLYLPHLILYLKKVLPLCSYIFYIKTHNLRFLLCFLLSPTSKRNVCCQRKFRKERDIYFVLDISGDSFSHEREKGVGVTKPDTDRKWREVGIKM